MENYLAGSSFSSSGAGWCPVCKCFISSKRPHSDVECASNIAKRKNRGGVKRPRITVKKATKLRSLISKAVRYDYLASKLEALKRHMAKTKSKKISEKAVRKALTSASEGRISQKERRWCRYFRI